MCAAQQKEMSMCGKMDGKEEFNRERYLKEKPFLFLGNLKNVINVN